MKLNANEEMSILAVSSRAFSAKYIPLSVPRYGCPGMTMQRSGGIHLGLSSVPIISRQSSCLDRALSYIPQLTTNSSGYLRASPYSGNHVSL